VVIADAAVITRAGSGGLVSWLRLLMELTKLPIAIMSTLTTATGYVLFAESPSLSMWSSLLGTLLLAAAAGTFNQLQEQHFDALMPRTRGRPLPSGRIDRPTAWLVGIGLAGVGFAALATGPEQPLLVLSLGAAALFWYNGVYTYLKRVTAFAVVPGALIGALPPAIGWCAAGGSIVDARIWLVAGFLFVWQVPHFWLLALRYDTDYRESGWPVLTDTFSAAQVGRLTFAWIVATVVTGFMSAVLVRIAPAALSVFAAASVWLVWRSSVLLGDSVSTPDLRGTFGRINLFALLACLVLAVGVALR
jgi:protoheme IX farnesyltransferase